VKPQPVPICCDRMRQLAEDYATATRLYAESVVEATRRMVASRSAYHELKKAVEAARKQAEVAARAFYRHIESHQFGVSGLGLGRASIRLRQASSDASQLQKCLPT
jgi:hypothetical protein